MNYKELKELLIKASNAYYIDNNPIMSDYEFDIKLNELEKLEQQQGFADEDSPTRKPGSDLELVDMTNKHGRPMLSLENTYSFEEIEKWYNDVIKATGDNSPEVIVDAKYDGGSGALRFNQSGLQKALTRGNGEVGEDITQNVKYCSDNIWSKKSYYGMPFIGEVRGELIMTKEGFNKLNNDGKYQNARNLLSGSLKLLDIYEFIPRAESIKFYAYWLEESTNQTYEGDLAQLKMFGFDVGKYYVCHNIDEIKKAINELETADLGVALDGAVLKLNNKKYWSQLGSTSKFPRWARAYKYKQESVQTVIRKIEFWAGRTGKITPVAWFEPRFLDGSTIQKATLNNKDFYDAMDIAVGDTVSVQKAAAIIPQIISVDNRPIDRVKIPFPKKCPNCGAKLVKHNEAHADWYCDNIDCSARIVDQIINYTHALEIDGFAEIIVERLYGANLLNSISDLYRLNEHIEEISKLERLSEKIARKLAANIEDSKTNDFWKLLTGLGIPNVGPKTAKVLAKKFKTMKVLQTANREDFLEVEDIGEIVSESIILYFQNHKKLIQELTDFGVNMTEGYLNEDNKPSINLEGKTFCITGALSLTRDIYINLIETCGGKVVSSVSKKTSYLITNDKTTGTTKNMKARELGIPILNERELLEMCDSLSLLKEIEGL